jgi:LysR family transcriptional regulator, nitrogen assimilation regulatory protein
METRYLRSFLKIAETGSITRAAESLGISQPSLSQQLLRLEDEVGAPLFSRTARGVTVTDSGRLLQEHARQILRGVDLAVEGLRHLGDEPVGDVIVAVPHSVSKLAGVRMFEAAAREAPHVRLRLVEALTGQIWGWLEDGKIDLGLLNYLGPRRGLTFREIASEELFLIGPSGKFGTEAEPTELALADLVGLPMILPGLPHGLRRLIDQETARHGVTLQVWRDLDLLGQAGRLIAAGYGCSILPLPTVADDVAAGSLSIARIAGGMLRRRLMLARNSGEVITRASIRAEQLIVQVLHGLIATGEWRATPSPEAGHAPSINQESP